MKWEDLKCGQIWNSVGCVRREIVAIGPEYIALKEVGFGGVYTYPKDYTVLHKILQEEIVPKVKMYFSTFFNETSNKWQALALCSTSTEADDYRRKYFGNYKTKTIEVEI